MEIEPRPDHLHRSEVEAQGNVMNNFEQSSFAVQEPWTNRNDGANSSREVVSRESDLPDRSVNDQLNRQKVQALSDKDVFRLVKRLARDNKVYVLVI